jgi:hypothetical protein
MKRGILAKTTTAMSLTAGTILGISAYHYNSESNQARVQALAAQAQDYGTLSSEWTNYANGEVHNRNVDLIAMAFDVGALALCGYWLTISSTADKQPQREPDIS